MRAFYVLYNPDRDQYYDMNGYGNYSNPWCNDYKNGSIFLDVEVDNTNLSLDAVVAAKCQWVKIEVDTGDILGIDFSVSFQVLGGGL